MLADHELARRPSNGLWICIFTFQRLPLSLIAR